MTPELEQDGGGLPPQAMLTVAAVARRLGVAPSTLRTWDRRYGLGPSAHTAGSHRRYSPSDVSRLVVMRGLVMEGVPPAEAAQISLGTAVDVAGDASEALVGGPGGGPSTPSSASMPTAAPSSPLEVIAAARRETPPAALPTRPVTWSAPSGPHTRRVPPPALPLVGPAGVVRPAGVPASRGMPPAEGGLPEGSGRAFWPMSPLAAHHLLQSVGDVADRVEADRLAADRPAADRLAADQGVADPDGAERPAADGVPTAAADEALVLEPEGALDAALAQVIDEALGRSPERVASWTAPTARAGGGRVISLPDASPRARGLARAAMSLDTHELSRLLRDAIGTYGVIGAWDSMVLPVLRGLGERWQATGDGIDVEHAFSEATLSVLGGVAASLHRPRNVRPVLLACSDGDFHSLPLHVLAAALAEVEVGCRLLGVGLPGRALVAATRRTGPAVVFVYARLPVTDGSALREFPRQRPAPRVLVGGPGWQYVDVPASVVQVGSLRAAVDEVRAAVQI